MIFFMVLQVDYSSYVQIKEINNALNVFFVCVCVWEKFPDKDLWMLTNKISANYKIFIL